MTAGALRRRRSAGSSHRRLARSIASACRARGEGGGRWSRQRFKPWLLLAHMRLPSLHRPLLGGWAAQRRSGAGSRASRRVSRWWRGVGEVVRVVEEWASAESNPKLPNQRSGTRDLRIVASVAKRPSSATLAQPFQMHNSGEQPNAFFIHECDGGSQNCSWSAKSLTHQASSISRSSGASGTSHASNPR